MTLRALVYRSFRRTRGLLISIAAVLVVFQALIVLAASYVQEEQGFSRMIALLPPMIQQMTGGIFSSFGTMVAFGYFHPVVITVFVGVAIVVGSEPAVDVESRVVDLVLARPIRRGHLVTRSVLMLALVTTSLGLLMVASSWLSLRMVGPRGVLSAGVLFRLALNLAAVAWVVGALALAAAAFVRRRSTAAGSVAIIALALYLVNFLADVLPRVRPYAPLSPFHYYQPLGIVTGMGTRWGSDVRLLVIVAALLTAAAFVAFSRRDL